jgi:hypothetical protein
MSRLAKIEDILFPVEEHPVFVHVKMKSGERRLPVSDKKAILNSKTNRVLGVVSRGYRLVKNTEALEWAYQCCTMVFPNTKPVEWEVKASDAPQTGGHCFIDLVHNSSNLDFHLVDAKSRPDAFGPFIRVTNSYNGLRALAFDVGFYRKVCQNGMIIPESVIRFKFNHMRRDIGNSLRFEIDNQKLSKLKDSFQDLVGGLKECRLPRAYFEILLRKVLAIHKPKDIENIDNKISADWKLLNNHLGLLCDRYFMDLGDNAYAAFNALTDFASHPPENRCLHRDRHSMQRLAGEWLAKFSQECRQSSF